MADTILEPEGSIEISAERHGIPAGVTIFFVFSGDWANMYDDGVDTEAEARASFVREVQLALEERRDATRASQSTEGSTDPEDRGE